MATAEQALRALVNYCRNDSETESDSELSFELSLVLAFREPKVVQTL